MGLTHITKKLGLQSLSIKLSSIPMKRQKEADMDRSSCLVAKVARVRGPLSDIAPEATAEPPPPSLICSHTHCADGHTSDAVQDSAQLFRIVDNALHLYPWPPWSWSLLVMAAISSLTRVPEPVRGFLGVVGLRVAGAHG